MDYYEITDKRELVRQFIEGSEKHPDLGKTSLNMILSIYIQHLNKHFDYMTRNKSLYKE